ncbi:MAG: ferritin family protein [Pseudomonadota bacterium]
MSVFTASDIVEFAIRIEENGANFYRFAVQIARDEGTKNLFEQLANAELNHKKIFEKIFAAMDKTAPPEGYAGEYAAYLHNYVDNAIIFKKEALDQELAKVNDSASALDFALQREMDSILYYHEIKRLVPAHDHAAIDQIMEEERRHVAMLSAMKHKQ